MLTLHLLKLAFGMEIKLWESVSGKVIISGLKSILLPH